MNATTLKAVSKAIVALTSSPDYYECQDKEGMVAKTIIEITGKAPTLNRHNAFIKLWSEAYNDYFGHTYVFHPRDAKAVQSLIGSLDVDQILALAREAWKFRDDKRKHFNCQFSVSIHSFHSHLNEIRAELATNMSSLTVKPVIREGVF